MGKASRTKQDSDRRARIAAQREAERRRSQRRRIYLAGGSVLVVAIVVIAFVLVKLNSGSSAAATAPTGTALTQVIDQVTGVPASTTDEVSDGGVPKGLLTSATPSTISSVATSLGSYFATVNDTALTSGGKPEVLFLGAEYCPFCAAQRWAMINSLSRFGTFSGLTTTHSASGDTDPNTPTFSFVNAKYTSSYLTFTSVEQYTNQIDPKTNYYKVLQTATAAQSALASKWDPGSGSGSPIPFIDIAGKYVQVGNLSPLSPSLFVGKTWAQVAAAMNDPSSSLGKAIIGNANYMTAAICKVIDNKAATACTPAIQKLQANLAG
jgi:hypothetical protein